MVPSGRNGQPGRRPLMSGRILLVEPVPATRALWRAHLSAGYHAVTQAASMEAALERLSTDKPDLILASQDLCDGDGLTLCRRLKADPLFSGTPVLVAGPAGPDFALSAFAAGAEDVLVHPTGRVALLARVRKALREKGLMDTLDLQASGFPILTEDPGQSDLFSVTGRVLLVPPTREAAAEWRSSLASLRAVEVAQLDRKGDLVAECTQRGTDLVVIEHRPEIGLDALRKLARLRAATETRHVRTLVLMEETRGPLVPLALELGVGDFASPGVAPGELAGRVALQLRRGRQGARLREELHTSLRLVDTDPMTGIYNRRYLSNRMPRVLAAAAARNAMSAVMMLDLDHFKQINDRYGHPVGDRILIETARRLQSVLRRGDLLARYGGEEFFVLRTDTDPEGARAAAEAIRAAVEARPVSLPQGQSVSLTVSVGVSLVPPGCGKSAEVLLTEADQALYRSKAAGRNCVRFHEAA